MMTSRQHRRARVGRSVLVMMASCVFVWSAGLGSAAHAEEANVASDDAAGIAEPVVDTSAQLFQAKCLGCHTIGSGPLTGPDLKSSAAWKDSDLRLAIVRMEDKVGPLPDEEVDALLAFLKDATARERLEAEQERVALLLAATFEAGSVQIGRVLFNGMRSFANGGAACNACHNVGADCGGTLAPDLTLVHARMGEQALLSACENASFPVMRAMYAAKPVRKQEAIHLVAYLAEAAAEDAAPSTRGVLLVKGLGGAAAVLGMFALPVIYSRRNRGVRSRLVSESIKSAHP